MEGISSTKLAICVDKKYINNPKKINDEIRDNAIDNTLDTPLLSRKLLNGSNITDNKQANANGTRMFWDI